MKTLLFTSILMFQSVISFAQSKQHPLIPLSSTAAALGKYGNIDVSLATGQINPTIKICEVKFNDFVFPVDLSYASSGLKVHETPSSVGLGWALNGTGVINRQVKSVPDEQTHGYNGLQSTGTVVQSIANGGYTPTSPYASVTQENFQRGIGQTDYDGEPDLFNFSFPKHGGTFSLMKHKLVVVLKMR